MTNIERARSKRVLRGQCILVPVDFSPASGNAFAMALDLLGHHGRLVVLHVVPPSFLNGPGLRDSIEAGRKNLKKFARSMGLPDGPRIKLMVRAGTPFQQILATAADHQAALITLGIDNTDAFGGFALGHTADRISRYARCSVLLVRSGDRRTRRVSSVFATGAA